MVVPACLLALLVALASAQEQAHSVNAQALSEALVELRKSPNDPLVQQHYLQAFPQSYKDFLELFDSGRPLYDGHDYIEALSLLAKGQKTQVGELLINLSKDAHYQGDAPGYLQNATAVYGSHYTKTFAQILKLLPDIKRRNLISFVADVENYRAYPEYQMIIDRLEKLGDSVIAEEFKEARAKRLAQRND